MRGCRRRVQLWQHAESDPDGRTALPGERDRGSGVLPLVFSGCPSQPNPPPLGLHVQHLKLDDVPDLQGRP